MKLLALTRQRYRNREMIELAVLRLANENYVKLRGMEIGALCKYEAGGATKKSEYAVSVYVEGKPGDIQDFIESMEEHNFQVFAAGTAPRVSNYEKIEVEV